MHPEDHFKPIARAKYGHGFEVVLYKTVQGQFFTCVCPPHGGTEKIQLLNRKRAIQAYNGLSIHMVEFEDAFPSLEATST